MPSEQSKKTDPLVVDLAITAAFLLMILVGLHLLVWFAISDTPRHTTVGVLGGQIGMLTMDLIVALVFRGYA